MVGCSPLKTSPHDEKHQLELTLHEVQTNLDDLRHDLNCFQTELQILDGRIKYSEKNQDTEKQQAKIELMIHEVQVLEKKAAAAENSKFAEAEDVKGLMTHAKEMTAALVQCKNRIEELEKELIAGQRRVEELGKLRSNFETLAKSLRGDSYKVRQGDSLEKIARIHKTTVDKIKKLNGMEQDLIVIGQELQIPRE